MDWGQGETELLGQFIGDLYDIFPNLEQQSHALILRVPLIK